VRVMKRRKGHKWAKRRLPKSWPARAILGEDGTRYLIQWEPVRNGMACEEAWEPKAHANDALVAEWEERKTTRALGDIDDEREDVPDSQEEEQEVGQRYSHVVNTRTSGCSKGSAKITLREATSTTIPDISNIPIPKTNVAVAQMYDHHRLKGSHNCSPMASNRPEGASARPRSRVGRNLPAAVEDNHGCDEPQLRDDLAAEVRSSEPQPNSPKVASSTVQHLVKSASFQQLPMTDAENSVYAPTTDGIDELESFLVEAATTCVSQNRKEKTSAQDIYGVQLNDCSRAEGFRQILEGHGTKVPLRLGTSIGKTLSLAPSTLSNNNNNNNNNKDHRAATSARKDSGQASSRTSAHVEVSNNRDRGVSGAASGKLANAREQLRSLLRGPGRRRFRKSSPRFPPSP
jgi:hypothetical protein